MYFSRLALLIISLVCCALSTVRSPAATNDTLCSEEDLFRLIEVGGDYIVECGSNIVSISLSKPLVISRRISIISSNEIVLSGQNLTRLMVIQPGVEVTLGNFSFFSGRQTETNLNNGGIDETAGGAIYNNGGKLTVLKGRFQQNSVVGITGISGQDGAGENGLSGGDAAGGAIYNNGGLNFFSNVVFQANSTIAGVGGKGGNGRSTGFGQDGGNAGAGGSAAGSAIYSNGGRVVIIASTFSGNTATGGEAGEAGSPGGSLGFPGEPAEAGDGVGGAIATSPAADLTIFGATFVTNSVKGANGSTGNAGIGRNDGEAGRNGGDAAGGAIYATGAMWITNSTFFRNTATSGNGGDGGAGSAGGFGFSGGDGGNGGVAAGGALESNGNGAAIVNCTFSDNTAIAGTGGAGGAGSGLGESGSSGSSGTVLGAGIYGSGADIRLANSIIANSRPTLQGNINDLGGNLTTDRNLEITSPASLYLASARLLPLANNGGPTLTMRIPGNSIAVDKGIAAYCQSIDQRGTNRVGTCDIGAFEFVTPLNEVLGTNGIQISTTNNSVVLRWPAGHTNLVLQRTTNLLTTNTIWVPVTSGIVQTNSVYEFVVSPDLRLPLAFYRLFTTVSTNTTGGSTFPPFPPFPPVPTRSSSTSVTAPENDSETASSDLTSPPLPPSPSSEPTNSSGASAHLTRVTRERNGSVPLPPLPN